MPKGPVRHNPTSPEFIEMLVDQNEKAKVTPTYKKKQVAKKKKR